MELAKNDHTNLYFSSMDKRVVGVVFQLLYNSASIEGAERY
jgi:hypothetical protein